METLLIIIGCVDVRAQFSYSTGKGYFLVEALSGSNVVIHLHTFALVVRWNL